MPAISLKDTTTITSGSAVIQAREAYDILAGVLTQAGYTEIRRPEAYGGDYRGALWRFPQLDEHDTYSDIFLMHATDGTAPSGILTVQCAIDVDAIQPDSISSVSELEGSWGGWTDPTIWPSNGLPVVGSLADDGREGWSLPFDENESFTIRVVANEYGFALAIDDFGNNSWVRTTFRPLDSARMGRDIHVSSSPGAAQSFPVTISTTPVSGKHLSFDREGVAEDVLFPQAVHSEFDLQREFTLKTLNFIEMIPEHFSSGGKKNLRVRLPLDSAPAGDVSTKMPQLKCTYQDPDWVSDTDVHFDAWPGTFGFVQGALSFTPGTGSSITLSNTNGAGAGVLNDWIVTYGVRPGAIIHNHNDGSSVEVSHFVNNAGVWDEIVIIGSVPAGWSVAGDQNAIEVYKGPFTHADGVCTVGGTYQAVVQGSEGSDFVKTGGVVDVVLNDIYGEAYAHYEVGQTVMVMNNGLAVILEVPPSQPFRLGELVEMENGISEGSKGVIRAIYGANDQYLVVETILGAKNAPGGAYKIVPWSNSIPSTIQGKTSGVTGAQIANVTASTNIGQIGKVSITSKTQIGSGDFRTVLSLDTSALQVHVGLKLSPSFLIGNRLRYQLHWKLNSNPTYQVSDSGSKNDVDMAPELVSNASFSKTTTLSGYDGGRVEANANTNSTAFHSAHEPDWETGTLRAFEFGVGCTSDIVNRDMITQSPLMRGVPARGAGDSKPDIGDRLEEDQDSRRVWVPVGKMTSGASANASEAMGAGSELHKNQYICIGTGISML